MIRRREAAHRIVLLAGAAVLLGFSIARLPPDVSLLRAPATPIDRSASAETVSDYRLLASAATVLPPEAWVAAISEPSNPSRDTALHRMAVALLPGRRIFAGAYWGVAVSGSEQAEYLVVAGAKPKESPGRLLLDTPWGTVWRRPR